MNRVILRLKAFVNHPGTQFASGLVLLISGGSEAIRELVEAKHSFQLGAHHGVLVMGLTQMLGNLPELVEGIERFVRARDPQQEV